jgi:hypothetical protein
MSSNLFTKAINDTDICSKIIWGRGWLNELGSWITWQLIQAYHQYDVGLHPVL